VSGSGLWTEHDCAQHLWLSLGKQLLEASGVDESDLEGDGSQPAATTAAAAAAGGSSTGVTLKREGVEVNLPADVAARMQLVWDAYGRSLFCAIRMYRGEPYSSFETGIDPVGPTSTPLSPAWQEVLPQAAWSPMHLH